MDNLNDKYTNVLALSSVYHNIGRFHDNYCCLHGKLSIDKATNLKLLNELDEETFEIVNFIISEHCIEDEVAIKSVHNYRIRDTEKAILLYKYFCDCDSLDRCRLPVYKLDPQYLRCESSHNLIQFADELYEISMKKDNYL